MASTDPNDSSSGDVTFYNVIGIILTVILVTVVMIFLSRSLRFIKLINFKIQIIMKNASYKCDVPFNDYDYPTDTTSPLFTKMERLFKHEVRRSRSLSIINIFKYLMHRYNYLVNYHWRNRDLEEYSLLRPNDGFLAFVNSVGFLILWFVSIFIMGNASGDVSTGSAFGYAILAAMFSSPLTLLINRYFCRIYFVSIKKAFANYDKEAPV
jgi:hypothetical protein